MEWIKIKQCHISDEFTDAEVGCLIRFQLLVARLERMPTDKEISKNTSSRTWAATKQTLSTHKVTPKQIALKILEDCQKTQRNKSTSAATSQRYRNKNKAKSEDSDASRDRSRDVSRDNDGDVSRDDDVTVLEKRREEERREDKKNKEQQLLQKEASGRAAAFFKNLANLQSPQHPHPLFVSHDFTGIKQDLRRVLRVIAFWHLQFPRHFSLGDVDSLLNNPVAFLAAHLAQLLLGFLYSPKHGFCVFDSKSLFGSFFPALCFPNLGLIAFSLFVTKQNLAFPDFQLFRIFFIKSLVGFRTLMCGTLSSL